MDISFTCCGISCCGENGSGPDARISQKEIGSIYDRLAPVYDIWGALTESKARERAIELAGITDGQNILEVAVGTGIAFYEIVKRNPHGTNTGIDLSRGMLEKARRRLKRLPDAGYRLEVGSAFDLEMADQSIDIMINNYMFDLIPFDEMDGVLREFKRVLKKGGRLVLVNMTGAEGFGSGIYERIYNLSPRLMGGCRGVKLANRLEQNGFRVDSREYVQQMLFPSEVILAYK